MRALLYKDLVVNRSNTLLLWAVAGLACLLPPWLGAIALTALVM